MKTCPACHATYPTDYTHCPRDLTPLTEVGVWQEGTMVRGRYRILGRVGVGGMASVYKALHIHFRELRALKVIKPELVADATFVQRFTEEAIITRRLQHPNAVRVDDIDQAEDGSPFIVMEYIEGRSLKDVMQAEGPMPVARVVAIAKQVAAALGAAHDLGMVHRDIKPANIVLVGGSAGALPAGNRDAGHHPATPSLEHPIAKVLDFGIAKIKEGHLEDSRVAHMSLTEPGMVVGTPSYMSPEQAMGKRGNELDSRSDLYSLGVVMYQMLTGELPLQADSTLQILMAQVNMVPAPIQSRRSDIPDAIATLVMQCLEKDREKRPSTDQELIAVIERWERTLPGQEPAGKAAPQPARSSAPASIPGPHSQALSPPMLTATPGAARRWRALLTIAGGALIVAASVVGLRYRSSREGRGTAPPAAGASSSAPTPAAAAAPPPPELGAPNSAGDGATLQQRTSATQGTTTPNPGPAKVVAPTGVRNKPSLTTPQEPPPSSPKSTIEGNTTLRPPSSIRTPPAPPPSEPSRPVASYLRISRIFADGGDYDKAIGECQKGLQVYPGNSLLEECIETAKEQKEKEKQVLSPH